ncbi:enoyl-CoA hydratase/isomerase family protein [Nocardia lijiangensis]|uniref:enoyl-CoA hydratase/isomerase family protein n=1 Tax=Nocardia lijiangensis TaxID=299618 RepID=UPI0008316984|nr:enoyl-CoA hydratase/isomerase family protein [Nocardia lijiangensis]
MPHLRREDAVFVLDLGEPDRIDTENRFTPEWMDALHACLDEVQAADGPKALVTTGSGKFYSNGFEPERFAGPDAAGYLLAGQRVFERLLTFPAPTVAAVQGHAFGAGAILAVAHDGRVMRGDRGYFCLPEITLPLAQSDDGLVIPGGIADLLTARLPGPAAHEAMLTGRRYGGHDALAAGIVEAVEKHERVLPVALTRAGALAGTAGPALGAMKRWMYRDVVAALGKVTLTC